MDIKEKRMRQLIRDFYMYIYHFNIEVNGDPTVFRTFVVMLSVLVNYFIGTDILLVYVLPKYLPYTLDYRIVVKVGIALGILFYIWVIFDIVRGKRYLELYKNEKYHKKSRGYIIIFAPLIYSGIIFLVDGW